MKNIIYISILCLLSVLFFNSCSRSIYFGDMSKVATQKIKNFCETEDSLELRKWGFMYFVDESNLTFSFTVYREIDQNEARILCLRIVEKVENILNTTEDVRKDLINYPCSPYDFSVMLNFCKPEMRSFEYTPACSVKNGMDNVAMCKGFIYYGAYDPKDGSVRDFCKERYETAQRIARELQEKSKKF